MLSLGSRGVGEKFTILTLKKNFLILKNMTWSTSGPINLKIGICMCSHMYIYKYTHVNLTLYKISMTNV